MVDKEPKILTIDIETSPIIAYTWGPKYEAGLIENVEESKVICYSAKWLDGKQVTKGLDDYPGYKPNTIDDKRIVEDIHKLLDEADIIISQNGISFDHKVLNARMLGNNMQPPSPFKMIDTKIEAKRYLRLPSYGLDDMAKYFGFGSKLAHEGFNLWKKCIAGDKKAWKEMKKYNAQDVLLTEKVYLKIRPFMRTHPNMSSFTSGALKIRNTGDCPKCGSTNTHSRGHIVNSVSIYSRAQCQDCGGWYRYGQNIMKNKKGISTSI